MPLLACRVGRHNLIRKDKSSDPYGDFGGSGDEEENLDDQNFGDYEESHDLDDELNNPDPFGPHMHAGLDYNTAQTIWQIVMRSYADN